MFKLIRRSNVQALYDTIDKMRLEKTNLYGAISRMQSDILRLERAVHTAREIIPALIPPVQADPDYAAAIQRAELFLDIHRVYRPAEGQE